MKNLKGKGLIENSAIYFLVLMLYTSFLIEPFDARSSNRMPGEGFMQQDIEVKGVVADENGTPIPGVSIVLKGTLRGTVTDINGEFTIDAPESSTLVASFIGFQSEEITVERSNIPLKITLAESTESIEEVVIIGYGTQKKETVTGSMSTVSADELVQQPVSNISQALAGRLPGLIANQAGGRPGKDAATIKIRGIGTLDAGSGSNPLILIDGIERDQTALNFLDPNEIESLSILKDASSTAVFGVRGANGVILVTTKRGKLGPPKITYKSNVAVIQPNFRLNLLNSYQQTGLANEYMGFDANTVNPSAPYPQSVRDRYKGVVNGNPVEPADPYFYPSTNYEELMLKDYAMQQQHNFSISGGTERVRYFASLGYFDQDGLFKNINPEVGQSTSYKRYNYRANVDVDISKTTLAKINIGGSFNQNIGLGQAGTEPNRSFYWNLQVHSSPWDGYFHDGKVVMITENANSVLLNSDMRGYNIEQQNTADYSIILNQKLDFITSGLSVKGTTSLVSYFSNYIQRNKDEKKIPIWKPFLNDDGSVSFFQSNEDVLPNNSTSQGKSRKEYYEVALNYDRTFNSAHTVTALALVNAEKSHFTETYWNMIPRSYLGVVGRLTYNYMNRYMAEYNLGYNGSENFAEGKRFGFFPAYSLGWTFTEEPWLNSLIGGKFLSYGKFRFSYGTVGNDRMSSRFLYLPDKYVMGQTALRGWYDAGVNFGPQGGVQNYPIAYQGTAGNPNVTWEKSKKINYGADLSFIDGKLTAKFDYFTEDRKDILINQRVVPIYQQTGALALNLGRVKNEGYEIELGWNQQLKNFRYWMDLNYSFARNEIIEMDEPQQPLEYRMQTGRRVGEIWGYRQEGFFNTVEEAEAYKNELWQTYKENNPDAERDSYQAYQIFNTGSDVSAGDLKFIDRNNDGVINDLDEGYLDRVNFPESMFAVNTGFQLKQFSFSVLLQGATNFAINARTNNVPDPTRGSMMDFILNRYTPERYEAGEKIEFPRLLNASNNWKFNGTYWIQDATYLRVKSVEVGYTFDSSRRIIKTIGLDNFRIYLNGLNLYTFTGIKYLDPETTNGELRYPRSRVFNLGISAQF